mmetsp:Transcript_2957/g.6719  ORF Transcript_2957/g.6719 Transcript_2957/m.6719 type:complete len:674 (+) Transcript_2957:68-2089(+)|eukprot:CAMPEP_0204253344 /NCGR_PEP_ID=MMETSP0468-20130131/1817_1 /ASSEMBLY_ACC=CAM_ASM_000383 /TAXON_ID=2969 /ORGANISM="Oxyrrhis marina" /LENGTH=673 /DNA_ID=CAMNT_0051226905 /DNA_START=68 /DNA_END=2089 /DNA_ORIENTATION=-
MGVRTVAVFAAVAAGSSELNGGNPVSKVLQLLQSLAQKVIQEGEAEQKQYEKFVDWCQETARNNQWQMKNGAERADALKAQIEKYNADIQSLEALIEEQAESIAKNEDDLDKANNVRKHEHGDWSESDRAMGETIDTVERAIALLKKQAKKGFMQIPHAATEELTNTLEELMASSLFTVEDKKPLMGFMQSKEDAADDAEYGAMQPDDDEQRQDPIKVVVNVMEDLLDKALSQRSEASKQEKTAQFNFDMLKQSLTDEIATENKEMKSAKKNLAGAQEALSNAEGDLALTEKGYTGDAEGLHKLQQDCMEKASDHEISVKERSEELAALAKAEDVIRESTGGASKQAYSFSQVLQKGADLSHVVSKLRSLSRSLDDMQISFLASQISTTATQMDDPFAKVKGLITQMVDRLEQQAKAEAGHKEYCDKEMAKATMKKMDHEDAVDSLTSKFNKAVSRIATLKQDIIDIDADLAALDKSGAESMQNRQSEHADYLQAKKDYEQGVDGVQQAIKVLRDYYASDAFVQQPSVGSHSKGSGSAQGIIGLLEVAESDFSKMLAEVEADEREAEEIFEKEKQENKMTKVTKETDRKYKEREEQSLESTVSELRQDRDSEQNELDAVLEYTGKLNKMCVSKPDSYEERKQRREAEIDGLKQALEILEGSVVSLVAVKEVRH